MMHGADSIVIVEREMTSAEFARMNKGFEEHTLEFGVDEMPEVRYGYVALDGETFIGCVSGLQYRQWFYITDLWLEKAYRKRGLGAKLLQAIEMKAGSAGVKHIWTWTAGYEAPSFYQKYGYRIFCEFEDYYSTRHSRIGLRKLLRADNAQAM
jgi:GNAT superfamily N-acetyltransferase